jgi:hypothetical protein
VTKIPTLSKIILKMSPNNCEKVFTMRSRRSQENNYTQAYKRRYIRKNIRYPSIEIIISKISAIK